MAKPRAQTIEEILAPVDPVQKEIVARLRGTVKSAVPKASETVRRGRITYMANGKDFAAIQLTKSHVDLAFPCGQKLSSSMLKGNGMEKDLKHVQITTMRTFDWPELVRLLQDAEALTAIT